VTKNPTAVGAIKYVTVEVGNKLSERSLTLMLEFAGAAAITTGFAFLSSSSAVPAAAPH